MARQLFVLRGVPDDEAEAIGRLLDDASIGYYETPPGNWGISIPALWVHNDADFDRASELIVTYQQSRYRQAREDYTQQKRAGKHPTLWRWWRENPLGMIVYTALIVLVLYFSSLVIFLSLR